MRTLRRPRTREPLLPTKAGSRPVLLATLDVPFDERATIVAVDAAVESGQGLIVANVVEIPPLPLSVVMGHDQIEYTPEMAEALNAPAELARSLGIPVERLRVRSLHPTEALLQLAAERSPGLLVFGPDRRKVRRLAYRRTVRALRRQAVCLVWLPE